MVNNKFLDPRAVINPKDRPLVPGLDSLEGKVIGIIDNGQVEFDAIFQGIRQAAAGTASRQRSLFKTKPTHMQGAPKPIMEEIVNRCDAVITGLGA